MKLSSHFKTAVHNLYISKVRTFLTMLGIIVGTASVVALLSSGQMASQQSLQQFKDLGIDLMSLSLSPSAKSGGGSQSSPGIPISAVQKLTSNVIGVKKVAPYIVLGAPTSFENTQLDAMIIGVTESLEQVIHINLSKGRFISSLDKNEHFCVIGQTIFQKMHTLKPIGQRIRLANNVFTIIGVAAQWPENNFFHASINESILIPISMTNLVSSSSTLSDVIMQLQTNLDPDPIKDNIKKYLKSRYPNYDFEFESAKQIADKMANQSGIFTLLLGFIGGIALLVGGIGIMNIMLASVSERKYEVGLRIALGAEPKDIQWMFLFEVVVLAMIGGGVGVVLGIISTYFVAEVAGWPFSIFLLPVFVAFSASVLSSVFFGFYPAYLASKLNPIEALRGT